MIKGLIFQQLGTLQKAIDSEKGAGLYRYNGINPEVRGRYNEVTRRINLTSEMWSTILSSGQLIEFINKSLLKDELIFEIFSSTNNHKLDVSELEKIVAVKSETISSLWDELIEEIESDEEINGTPYYGSNSRSKNIIFLDSLLFISEYGEERFSRKELVHGLFHALDSHQYEYLRMKEERMRFLYMLTHSFTKELSRDTLFKLHENQQENFYFYEQIYENLSSIDDLDMKMIMSGLVKQLQQIEDKESIKDVIRNLFEEQPLTLVAKWFEQLCMDDELVTAKEWKQLLSRSRKQESVEDAYMMVYGKESIQYKALSTVTRIEYTSPHYNLVKKSVLNKKKGFLNLILENPEVFKDINSIYRESVLFKDAFSQLVNLNTLNVNDLNKLKTMVNPVNIDLFKEEVPLTFKEFEWLEQQPVMNINIFYRLMNLPIGGRMKMVKELPSKHYPALVGSESEYLERVVELLLEKPLSHWKKDMEFKIKNAKHEHYLCLLVAEDTFKPYLSEIKDERDIEFIIQKQHLLNGSGTLEQAKLYFVQQDKDCKYMLNELGVTDSFIKENAQGIIEFADKDLIDVFIGMNNNPKQSSRQLANLKILTKAEIAGKLKQVKYNDEDFEKEIGMSVSGSQKESWKLDTRIKNEFVVEETSSYYSTIRIGELPVDTCMNWNDGMYSHCLLSNFDTNKKMLIAKDRHGRTVARAILRLTKGSKSFIKTEEKQQGLTFKDIDEVVSQEEAINPKEELFLFLERCYTSLDSKQEEHVKKMFLELASEKAASLNALFGAASRYDSNEMELASYYTFISYSKNGSQYLDSLTGQVTEETEGKYMKSEILLETKNEK